MMLQQMAKSMPSLSTQQSTSRRNSNQAAGAKRGAAKAAEIPSMH